MSGHEPDPTDIIALDIIDAWRNRHDDLFHHLVAVSVREFDAEAVVRQFAAVAACLLELNADDIGMSHDDYAAMLRSSFTTTHPQETNTP